MNHFLLLLGFVLPLFVVSQYQTVRIGEQEWMQNNLSVRTFRNGDSIPLAKNKSEWREGGEKGIPMCCYLENDSSVNEAGGLLYNWLAVSDPRGLAPEGFRIPSKEDFNQLIACLGGIGLAWVRMKDSTWSHDKSAFLGFNAVPVGYRYYKGMFDSKGFGTFLWTKDLAPGQVHAYAMYLGTGIRNSAYEPVTPVVQTSGHSVRCIRE